MHHAQSNALTYEYEIKLKVMRYIVDGYQTISSKRRVDPIVNTLTNKSTHTIVCCDEQQQINSHFWPIFYYQSGSRHEAMRHTNLNKSRTSKDRQPGTQNTVGFTSVIKT